MIYRYWVQEECVTGKYRSDPWGRLGDTLGYLSGTLCHAVSDGGALIYAPVLTPFRDAPASKDRRITLSPLIGYRAVSYRCTIYGNRIIHHRVSCFLNILNSAADGSVL